MLRGIKQGRGFIKKRFGGAIEILDDLAHNKFKDSESESQTESSSDELARKDYDVIT